MNSFLDNLNYQIGKQENNGSLLYITFKFIRSQKFLKENSNVLMTLSSKNWDSMRELYWGKQKRETPISRSSNLPTNQIQNKKNKK
jgi:hypothetical protein